MLPTKFGLNQSGCFGEEKLTNDIQTRGRRTLRYPISSHGMRPWQVS